MKINTAAIFGSLQLGSYVYIIVYATIAMLLIGHWPSYNNPDPKNLPTVFLNHIADLLVFMSLLSVLVYPIILLVAAKKDFLKKWHFWVYLSGIAIWTLDMLYFHVMNPYQGGLLSWIFD